MSDNIAWEVKEEGGSNNMWWPQGNAEQQQQQQEQQQYNLQQQQQYDVATSQHQQQMFNYKMASTFQNQTSNVDQSSPVGAQGMRGYDYMTGGNPQMNAPAQGNQWWYPPSTMDNMHSTMQSMQQQHHQQSMASPAQSPSPHNLTSQSEASQQQEANRQHQEAIQQHHQAIAEAQARHQQLQQQTAQLQHQLQQQHQQLLNNHHQQQILQQPLTQQKSRMPRGAKGDLKPRGRMTAYAFFVQTCREEHKKKHPEENVVFAEFSKKCAERWKTMSDKEKKRFHEMAETDKTRYDTEMQGYTPAKGEKQRGKKRKQVKDPNAPKRSLSAFFHFSNDERSKVKGANPDWGVGDVAKELGKRWADAAPETRAKFEAMADKDKIRYEREMTAYKKKNELAAQQQVPEEEPEEDEEDDDDDE